MDNVIPLRPEQQGMTQKEEEKKDDGGSEDVAALKARIAQL